MSELNVTARLEKEISDKVDIYCKNNGIKKGWFISRAVEQKLKQIEDEESQNVHKESSK